MRHPGIDPEDRAIHVFFLTKSTLWELQHRTSTIRRSAELPPTEARSGAPGATGIISAVSKQVAVL